MKRFSLIAALLALAGVTGCVSTPVADGERGALPAATEPKTATSRIPSDKVVVNDAAGKVVVEKIEFRPGISSATVEKLGRRHGCATNAGAGLITEPGPVEVYRIQCDNGATFKAKCELRQCQPMR